MAKAAKAEKKGEGKVAGCLQSGSSIANIYTALKDGKFHSTASLKACLKSKSVNIQNRLRRLHRKGLRTKQWRLEMDGDRVRLISGKPPADAVMRERGEGRSERPATKSKKSAPAAKKEATQKKAKVQDVPAEDE